MYWRTTILVTLAMLFVGCTVGESEVQSQTRPARCETLGPWSTWPEADWVRRIVTAGGYEVIGETGSAIVVAGKGHEFNIWTAETGRPVDKVWRRIATVRGIPVHGDRNLWRVWQAQGYTFWVKGSSGSPVPAGGRLAPVIDASLRLPFRDECDGARPEG